MRFGNVIVIILILKSNVPNTGYLVKMYLTRVKFVPLDTSRKNMFFDWEISYFIENEPLVNFTVRF